MRAVIFVVVLLLCVLLGSTVVFVQNATLAGLIGHDVTRLLYGFPKRFAFVTRQRCGIGRVLRCASMLPVALFYVVCPLYQDVIDTLLGH